MLSQKGHQTKLGSVPARSGGLWSAASSALQYFIGPVFHGILFPTSDGPWKYFDVARVRITARYRQKHGHALGPGANPSYPTLPLFGTSHTKS